MRKIRNHYPSYIFLLIFVLLVSVACSSGNDEKGEESSDPEMIQTGENIIKTSCIGCHGRDLAGDMGPSLLQLELSDEELTDILIKGQGAMPPATANGKEAEVIAYLKSIQE